MVGIFYFRCAEEACGDLQSNLSRPFKDRMLGLESSYLLAFFSLSLSSSVHVLYLLTSKLLTASIPSFLLGSCTEQANQSIHNLPTPKKGRRRSATHAPDVSTSKLVLFNIYSPFVIMVGSAVDSYMRPPTFIFSIFHSIFNNSK